MPASSRFTPRQDYSSFNAANAGAFADPAVAAEFPAIKLRFWNDRWASRVGLGELSLEEKAAAFATFTLGEASPLRRVQFERLAMRYHGHQFRHYNPQLGDGRGFLYAQCEDPVDHRLLDFGTKGSGQTPYSRAGDGRLTLKGAVREALATEMLESLGVNTSKTFSFFETGEHLERNDEPSPTRAAVLTRLSHGHIRFGTFQRLAVTGESDLMRKLVDYSVRVYFPELEAVHESEKHFAFLERVVQNSAELAASWMIAGFVHGVLNTDNMNITGESFDYGPWRFLPVYDPAFTAAYFDHEGLYSYGRQPEAVYWNLDQLARSLHAMVPAGLETAWRDRFVSILEKYPALFQTALLKKFSQRLGLEFRSEGGVIDEKAGETLFVATFGALGETKVGFEEFFYDWYGGSLRENASEAKNQMYSVAAFSQFRGLLDEMLKDGRVRMRAETPNILNTTYYQRGRPESILINEVESIWGSIDKADDWKPFQDKIVAMRERGRIHGFGI